MLCYYLFLFSIGESMRDANKGCVGTSIKASVPAPYGFDTSTSSFPTTTSPKIYSGSRRRTTGPIIDPVTGVELVGERLPSLCPQKWLSHHRKQRKLTELTKNQSFTSPQNMPVYLYEVKPGAVSSPPTKLYSFSASSSYHC